MQLKKSEVTAETLAAKGFTASTGCTLEQVAEYLLLASKPNSGLYVRKNNYGVIAIHIDDIRTKKSLCYMWRELQGNEIAGKKPWGRHR